MVTRTAQDIPGDALNVGLAGSREDVVFAMHAAGWFPADPITLKTSVEIVGSVVLDRAYRIRAGEPALLSGPQAGARLREARRARAPTGGIMCALAGARSGRGGAAGLARRGDLRSRRGPQPLYRGGDASHIAGYRCRARRADRRLVKAAWSRTLYQVSGMGPTSTAATARATIISPTAKFILRGWCRAGR